MQAYVILGQYLVLKKNQELFIEWLKETANANAKQAKDCCNCLTEWCDQFLWDTHSCTGYWFLLLNSQHLSLLTRHHKKNGFHTTTTASGIQPQLQTVCEQNLNTRTETTTTTRLLIPFLLFSSSPPASDSSYTKIWLEHIAFRRLLFFSSPAPHKHILQTLLFSSEQNMKTSEQPLK